MTSTGQLTLPLPPAQPPELWGVVVDEVLLNSLGGGASNWWAVHSGPFHLNGKLRHLVVLPVGAIVEIGPFARDDAEFARDHIVENGVHPRAVKPRRWTEQPHMPGCRKAKPCRLCTPKPEEPQS
ncbi:hypothetical protein OHA71_23645 [Streptomyces sp. NBC_00444]|uniref:hypothetical protein n=1 Tax=Streptomyces sp. NBC_00444 TaxID=2975744 RepID=UPI002E1DA429